MSSNRIASSGADPAASTGSEVLPPRHLVLGGSSGIGLAYAQRHARAGHRLWLVARGEDGLRRAERELLATGAAEVRTTSMDLLDEHALARLFEDVSTESSLRTLLVSGPSPPWGRESEVTPEDHELARAICVRYPSYAMDYALQALEPGGCLTVVSSSAAQEPPEGHPFHLSAVYRRQLAEISQTVAARLRSSGREFRLLHPPVVLTPLSERFALAQSPLEAPAAVLARYFGVSYVQSAEEYLNSIL